MLKANQTYIIKNSTDSLIVGVGLQIQELSRTHPVPQRVYFYPNELGRYEENTQLPVYRMQSKAKLTDLIWNVPLSNRFLMISNKSYELFRSMVLPSYQVFKVKFIYKGKMIDDYVTFSIDKNPSFLEFISWDDSKFYKTENTYENRIEELNIRSFEEFNKKKNELSDLGYGLFPDIKLNYQNNYDIIYFGTYPLPLGFLCSENAMDLINEAGLTGFEFECLPSELFLKCI